MRSAAGPPGTSAVDPRFKPFGEADCETEIKLLKDRYRGYFLDTAPFNLGSIREDVFLIVGRIRVGLGVWLDHRDGGGIMT